MKFYGYRRTNGTLGIRNYLAVISTVICANEVAEAIYEKVEGEVSNDK